ncbi:MAG: hypothetical protein E6147_03290 [Peptostreptococcus sp.]|uniref:hypothetical protein n=1 Tax=Peptostreptococcus sp. TaxID=1262 RepID=UPI00290FA132|nr:hypothetical protein [Peptostreptococcus sp.]MDU5350000.1 hypothetical protein [Peptostreptococcus sp.]MDU5891836.1 hypothetical protein [Peptostreptococcus sp.]
MMDKSRKRIIIKSLFKQVASLYDIDYTESSAIVTDEFASFTIIAPCGTLYIIEYDDIFITQAFSLIDTGGYEEITDMIVTQVIEQFDDFILTEVFDEVYTYRYARKTKLSALDFVMNLVNDKCFLNDIIKRMEASIV